MEAFWDLSSCRPLGMMGVGSIPWTAAREYANARGYHGELFEDFWFYMKEMDAAFLATEAKKASRAREEAARAHQSQRSPAKRDQSGLRSSFFQG